MTLIIIAISMSAFNESLMDVLLEFLLSVLFVGRFDLVMKSAPFEKMHFSLMSELCKPGLVWYLKLAYSWEKQVSPN